VHLELHLEGFVTRGMFECMSSFPSDHAPLFAALCNGVCMMNQTAGVPIGLYCFLVVFLLRIIFSLHWPSHILVGPCVDVSLALTAFGALTQLMSR
jgi:undecaprenyl-diphosphatase